MNVSSRCISINCLFVLLFLFAKPNWAKAGHYPDSIKTYHPKAAILAPLFLDSLFKSGSYRYGNSIPRFALPYLEFYNGIQIGMDSLNAERVNSNVVLVDSRKGYSLTSLLRSSELANPNILIGAAQSTTELRSMADFAQQKAIPFISVTLPNDGGVTNNPYLYILNPTLRTHVDGSFEFLGRYKSQDNIVVLHKKNSAEMFMKTWIEEKYHQQKGNGPKITFLPLSDSFATAEIITLLDSTRNNTVWAATLSDPFTKRIARSLAASSKIYSSTLLGMPTWDGLDFTKAEYKGIEVVYSTAFISRSGNAGAFASFNRKYVARQKSKPSDMAIKGYEFTYRFVKAYSLPSDTLTPSILATKFNSPQAKIFNEVNFQPVYDAANPLQVNYYENKKLYFIRKQDGLMKGLY